LAVASAYLSLWLALNPSIYRFRIFLVLIVISSRLSYKYLAYFQECKEWFTVFKICAACSNLV
jgi:hypothetical protein